MKLSLEYAICKAICDLCGEEEWLFIPISDNYGLLCNKCMDECGLEIDIEATRRNLGS